MRVVPYREAVGCLLWLSTSTRPDITFAVHQVARCVSNPTPAAWTAVKRIFRYLQGSKDHGLLFKCSPDLQLSGFSDTDWAGDSTRRTTSSSLVCIGFTPVAWKVSLLKNIALSSMEGELMGYSETGKLSLFVIKLADGMGLSKDYVSGSSFDLRGDNTAALQALLRSRPTPRSRHVEVRHFWVRQHVENGTFNLSYVSSNDNVADIGTKPLPPQRFVELRNKIVSN
jgi:hypothetical protein